MLTVSRLCASFVMPVLHSPKPVLLLEDLRISAPGAACDMGMRLVHEVLLDKCSITDEMFGSLFDVESLFTLLLSKTTASVSVPSPSRPIALQVCDKLLFSARR